jgi:hypothetical protein
MGQTVWELDGPMPTLNRSKTLIAMLKPYKQWSRNRCHVL